MQKPTILCVDDETDNVEALERLFRKKYNVLKATSGAEALSVLDQYRAPVALIITDQRMPEMTGVEFLEKTLVSHPETMRLLLTGYTDLESVISAVNKGQIFRYLTKPWDPVDLTNTVDRAVERYDLGQELKTKNQELEAAYGELKSLDTAKSNFMILVNHELKTPLTSILNFSALLGETKLDEEQSLFVDRIRRSGDRLKILIEDVLFVVKAETGQLKSDLRPLPLGSLKSYLMPDLFQQADQKGQAITDNSSTATVRADTVQLRQILNRLVHNAIKFGTEKSQIALESTVVPEGIRISVTNKGHPIAEKVIDKIFKPFFLDENIMNHSTGMGLGLTICQSLLQNHNSGLNIRNNPDGVTVSSSFRPARSTQSGRPDTFWASVLLRLASKLRARLPMNFFFTLLILICSKSAMAGEQKILVLGEEWILKGNSRLWLGSADGISAKPRGGGIALKGKRESVTEIRFGDREISVRVVRPEAANLSRTLTERTEKLAGLKVEWDGSLPSVAGRLHRLDDYRTLTKDLPPTAKWMLHAEIPKRLRTEMEDFLLTQLGANAPVRPLVYEDVPTALLNGTVESAKRWESRLFRWGVALRREESAVEMAPVVRVEIAVAELRRDRAKNLGIKWPGAFEAKLLVDGTWSGQFPFSAQAFESQGYGRILARPNVLCRSGKEAEFVAGGEFPIKIFNYRQQDVIWKRYGIVLKVKPKADASGRISLGLETEVSTIDPARTVDGIPGLLTNKVASHFDLSRPRTIVLSGLLKNDDSVHREGIPLLNSLPILGPLFGSKEWKENRSELVIFVRPSIVSEDEP